MSFVAQHPGICADCENPIRVGQEIEFNTASEVVHVICDPSRSDPLETRGFLCSRCGLIHPGVC